MTPAPLPIDAHLEDIAARLRARRALVLVAPPGAGKTTRVAPRLAREGPLILLQPRRVAARALARRIAVEQGWELGGEVGWQVRFERRYGPRTRLLVATEGILTARLQADPLLQEFATVVLDEFHERSLHADLALALARQAWRARDDLRLLVMSATLEAAPVADFLDGAEVLQLSGRPHPVALEHAPGLEPAEAVRRVLSEERPPGGRHVLVFLPGLAEIRRVRGALGGCGAELLPLHGALDADAQDAALAPSAGTKVVLATNVAETSLTVEGVGVVIDSGWQKVLRHDPESGLERLESERVAADSAAQRAGRAGRTGPGRCLRLWDARERLRPRREAELQRVDLCAPLLDVLAWGGDPLSFEWFEAPPAASLEAALELLGRLGLVSPARRLTPLGDQARRLPLHPRLACVLLAAGGSARAAAACALLAEGWRARPVDLEGRPADGPSQALACDLFPPIDRLADERPGLRAVASELRRRARELGAGGGAPDESDAALQRALLRGFPDRVARRREPGSARLLLCTGHGALLARESGVGASSAEYLVALELRAGERGPGSAALVRSACAIEPEWLQATDCERHHEFDEAAGVVRASERACYGALVLRERPQAPDPQAAETLLLAALERRGLGPENERILLRARFAGLELDLPGMLRLACAGQRKLPELELLEWLPHETRLRLEALAPDSLSVPSGRRVRLDYRADGGVSVAVKLQELFGLAESPRLGPRREPLTFELLAPNGRPVQTTRDLRSFWERTYAEVRRELRGRYPKHPWPEDPWSAPPSARPKPRR